MHHNFDAREHAELHLFIILSAADTTGWLTLQTLQAGWHYRLADTTVWFNILVLFMWKHCKIVHAVFDHFCCINICLWVLGGGRGVGDCWGLNILCAAGIWPLMFVMLSAVENIFLALSCWLLFSLECERYITELLAASGLTGLIGWFLWKT